MKVALTSASRVVTVGFRGLSISLRYLGISMDEKWAGVSENMQARTVMLTPTRGRNVIEPAIRHFHHQSSFQRLGRQNDAKVTCISRASS